MISNERREFVSHISQGNSNGDCGAHNRPIFADKKHYEQGYDIIQDFAII